MAFDLIIRGGTVVDGTGRAPRTGDVGLARGRITAVGTIPANVESADEIDARGDVVCPGFIDIHTHSDISLVHHPRGESKVLQGVTTDVIGNCSFSPFPIDGGHRSIHRDHLARLGDEPLTPSWTDLDGYATVLEVRGIALNVAPLLGHGTLRVAAMGVEDRNPTAGELETMRRHASTAFEQGAFGISTGLTHAPSSYAVMDEIVELSRVAASYGRLYATHARATAGREFAAIEEAAEVGRRSEARVQYSHIALNDPSNWGRADETLALFERCARELDIAFDVYPYDASCSSLTQYLPRWLQEGGSEAMATRLGQPDTRTRARTELARGFFEGIPWHWERVVISRAADETPVLAGHSIQELADEAGTDPTEYALRLCERYGNEVEVVLFYRTEADMLTFLVHGLATVGSDGSAIPIEQNGALPHPRHFGTFPRILGRYVREQRVLDLATAIHKMTGAPAARLGLDDRGVLREGTAADVVIFDPDAVADTATYGATPTPPLGIKTVLVAGEAVAQDGHHTGALPGRVLRSR